MKSTGITEHFCDPKGTACCDHGILSLCVKNTSALKRDYSLVHKIYRCPFDCMQIVCCSDSDTVEEQPTNFCLHSLFTKFRFRFVEIVSRVSTNHCRARILVLKFKSMSDVCPDNVTCRRTITVLQVTGQDEAKASAR